jgi:hypothetical protein
LRSIHSTTVTTITIKISNRHTLEHMLWILSSNRATNYFEPSTFSNVIFIQENLNSLSSIQFKQRLMRDHRKKWLSSSNSSPKLGRLYNKTYIQGGWNR